ncbi:MAG: hypothetical protein K5770_02280 [Lachnospiraceae bacterium]|nr:hypothetical protein [Lachnospiraceae bacterium]
MNVLMHNMQSMFTNRQLGITNNNKAKSTEKLSSGYKINRAADDAAGLTISEGMRRQIRGLTQGTKNTQDGISMCKIADGALAEVGDMMHRLTELSIKSANGTNTAEDREAIQEEVNQILNEIDRVSTSTTFNEHRIFASEPELKPNITINQANLSNTEIIENLLNKSYPAISQDVVLDDCDENISKDLANKFISDLSNFAIIDYLPRNGYTFPEDKSEIEPPVC